jgi:hypothetical protein
MSTSRGKPSRSTFSPTRWYTSQAAYHLVQLEFVAYKVSFLPLTLEECIDEPKEPPDPYEENPATASRYRDSHTRSVRYT